MEYILGPLLPIYAGVEGNSKQFSEQNPGPLARLHPSKDSMHIFTLGFLVFPQREETLSLTYYVQHNM